VIGVPGGTSSTICSFISSADSVDRSTGITQPKQMNTAGNEGKAPVSTRNTMRIEALYRDVAFG
jgi:hypothetical protein